MRATRGAGGPLGTPVRTPEILWHDSSGFVGIGWATWHFRRLDCRGALSFVYRRVNQMTLRLEELTGSAGESRRARHTASARPHRWHPRRVSSGPPRPAEGSGGGHRLAPEHAPEIGRAHV